MKVLCCIVVLAIASSFHPALPVLAQQKSDVDLVWPQPPEAARIRYVGYVHSERDIGKRKSFFGRVKRALVGGNDQLTVMTRPHDVYVDRAGRIYVTDRAGGGRLVVFDPNDKKGRVIEPAGAGRLGKPMGIDGDDASHVYIADPRQQRVVALDADGEFARAFGGPSELLHPVDVGVTGDGSRVFVIDSYQHQLLIFGRDGKILRRVGVDIGDLASKKNRPKYTASHGDTSSVANHYGGEPSDLVENRGSGDGEFRFPAFVAVGGDTVVYVSDSMNFRVQVFSINGDFIRSIGQLGTTPGSLSRPKGVGVDSKGHIYIADASFNNVQIFNTEGQLLLAFGALGAGHGEFWQPLGMFAAGEQIYVVDRFNDRVQIFNYLHVPDGESNGGMR